MKKRKMECNCKLSKVVKATILHMSDSEDMDEAIKYFEIERHKKSLEKTQELFDELARSQLAILFKLLIDAGELNLNDNKITTHFTEEKSK